MGHVDVLKKKVQYMEDKTIIVGSGSVKLAENISKLVDIPQVPVEMLKFPDNEIYVNLPPEKLGKKCYLIQSLQSQHHNPNDLLIEYILTVKTLKDLEVEEVVGIIPYLAYARQDKRFNPGEALSLRDVAEMIEDAGTDEIWCVDVHAATEGPIGTTFEIPSYNVSAMPLIGEYLSDKDLESPLVLSPDIGSLERAKTVAGVLGCDYDALEKTRLDGETVETVTKDIDVVGRDVIVVDDIISTGGTIVNACNLAKEKNARGIYVAATHGVFVKNALERIKEAGCNEIAVTDSIETSVSSISLAPIILDITKV